MATLTGHLVAETYKALLKMIDNDILTASEKQISDGLGGGTNVFIDQNGFLRANKYKVTGATSSQFLKGDGSLDSNTYLPTGTTTTSIPEGTNLYFTTNRVLNTLLTGFSPVSGTVEATDSILTAINKIWWNIENGGGGGGGYVPYTGAINNLNLGTYGLISDFVQFNTTNSSIPTTAGTMSWNDADGTADLKLKGGNVTLQIGQEEVLRVVNKTGATLAEADFRAVRIRSVAEGGAQGQRLAVVLAQGNNDPNSATTIGIVTENILNNEEGFITTSGEVKKIDTTGAKSYGGLETWVDGDVLYLSPTHPGYLTKVKPQAPNHTIIVGWVVYAHANNGKIFVKVDNGYELDELHNVKITNPQYDDFLMYDSVESVWINKDLHGTKGYLPYYYDTKVFEQSPIFTDGSQVIIGSDTEFATGNMLSVVGNLAVDTAFGYHLGTYQILFRNNATGEFRIGTNAANDFTTFFANGVERARISASGYLGVGLTNPLSMIHAKGTTAYPKIIIDNASPSGGGMFSAYQNGTETAMFGVSGAWLIDNSSDAAIVATRAGQGIQFYTNGSNSEKMGINSDGNVFIGQTPTYVAGATQLIVRGKTGAGYLGVNHYDMSIKGSINTFNSVFQIGTSTFHSVAVIVEDIERARFNSSGRLLLGTTTDNTVDMLQVNGSLIASAIKKSGGTSAQFLKADGSVDSTAYGSGTVTSVGASVPLGFAIGGSPITTSGTLAITFATGYSLPTTIKQTNWDDAYSWVSTFPTQTGNAGKYLTTNGTVLSWENVVLGVTSFNTRTGAISLLSADVTSALGYTPVTNARTLSINGTAYDLSADRSWTITPGSGMRNVQTFTATSGQTTFTITGGYTVGLIDVFVNGARLSSSDYTATSGTSVVLGVGVVTNDIVDIVAYTASATSGITGGGTSGYLAKWTGTTAINGSLIYDNGTSIGIGTASPIGRFNVVNNGTTSYSNQVFSNSSSTASLALGIGGSAVGASFLQNNAYLINSGNSALILGTNDIERMRIASTGDVGIGEPNPQLYWSAANRLVVYKSGTQNGMTFVGDAGHSATIAFALGISGSSRYRGYIQYYHSSDTMFFGTNAGDKMIINSSGNVGIGTTSPSSILELAQPQYTFITLTGTNATQVQMNLGVNQVTQGAYVSSVSNHPLILQTNSTERMRITSGGDLRINTTGLSVSAKLEILGSVNTSAMSIQMGTNGYPAISFQNSGGFQQGYIVTNASSVQYLSVSDYRLKEDFKSYCGLDLVEKINTYDYQWKNDKSRTIGVIAHELQEILPFAVSGIKDGKQMQGVDYSKIVPVLVQAIKELNAKLEAK